MVGVLKILPIPTTGCHFEWKILLKYGLTLEAWVGNTHPKPTPVPLLPLFPLPPTGKRALMMMIN